MHTFRCRRALRCGADRSTHQVRRRAIHQMCGQRRVKSIDCHGGSPQSGFSAIPCMLSAQRRGNQRHLERAAFVPSVRNRIPSLHSYSCDGESTKATLQSRWLQREHSDPSAAIRREVQAVREYRTFRIGRGPPPLGRSGDRAQREGTRALRNSGSVSSG